MALLHGGSILTWCLAYMALPSLASPLPVANTCPGMFAWLFSAPALSVPEDTASLAWDLVAEDCPPAPCNTLEYELDPVQELFSNVAYEREVAWAKYERTLADGLRNAIQHAAQI